MMKLITTFILLFSLNAVFSQTDTVRIDLEHSSMSLRKCKGILFNQYWGNTFSYPPSHKITSLDSSFIHNSDTIFFRICKNNRVLIEGLKLEGIEADGEIAFYNRKGLLKRTELWVQGGSVESDEAAWTVRKSYRKGKVVKEIAITESFEDAEHHCFTKKKIRKSKEKIIRHECHLI